MQSLPVESAQPEGSANMQIQSNETTSRIDQLNVADTNPQISSGAPSLLHAGTSGGSSNPNLINKKEGTSIPKLARVDGQQMVEKDMERLRLTVAVKSVYYEPGDSGSLKCAVLLRTSFILQSGNKLKFAMVPMSARPMEPQAGSQESALQDTIDIADQYPQGTQWAEVSREKGTKSTFAQPQISVTALGNGGSLSGLGTTKQITVNFASTISLTPVLITLDGRPTQLQWRYEDKNGIFYPMHIDLLIVVSTAAFTSAHHFPFQLHLENSLTVDIHSRLDRLVRLITRRSEHDHGGWLFRIKSKYKPFEAERALRKAEEDPNSIGLHASVEPWLNIQRAQ